MSRTPSSEPNAEALQQALRHWRRQGQSQADLIEQQPAKFTIAISRQRGAGGSRVAAELGTLLNWPVYDRNLIETIVEDTGVRAQLVESVDERRSNWFRECLEAFIGAPTISGIKYAHRLAQVLTSLAAHGDCIIVGRGASFLLPLSSTLRVRLVAPLKQRIAHIREDQQMSLHDAARHVTQIDSQRNAYVKEFFHKDPCDAELFDLVLNTARFSHSQCAELIVEAMDKIAVGG
jgi:cytidylate kinase